MSGANTAGEGAGFLASDVDKFVVGAELIEGWKEAFGLGQELVVEVGFDGLQNVVHTETIVTHGAHQIGKIGGLTRQAFKNIDKLRC